MRIGVDLGGTKIEAVALRDDGHELARQRMPTPAGDYEATVRAVVELVRRLEDGSGKRAAVGIGKRATVGIGTPGSAAPHTGLIRNANSVVLNGKPLERDIATLLGRPVRIANDANCLALSESHDGAGAGARMVFAVILGTGVGAGIVVDGNVIAGHNNIAGEWGHNQLPWSRADELPGTPCFCGKRGCIETFLSGPGLAREFAATSGRVVEARQVVVTADAGDAGANKTLAAYEDRLARALAHIVNVLDPDAIVVGGGLSNIARIYRNVPQLIRQYAIAEDLEVKLVPAAHGDSSGVRGAARLWPV